MLAIMNKQDHVGYQRHFVESVTLLVQLLLQSRETRVQ